MAVSPKFFSAWYGCEAIFDRGLSDLSYLGPTSVGLELSLTDVCRTCAVDWIEQVYTMCFCSHDLWESFVCWAQEVDTARRFTFTWSAQGPVIDHDALNSFWMHKIGQQLQGFDIVQDEQQCGQCEGVEEGSEQTVVRAFSPWDMFRSKQKATSPQPSDKVVSDLYWKLSEAEYKSYMIC